MAANATSAGPHNTLALRHGAESPRIVAARTAEIAAEWMDPESGLQLVQPVDSAAIWATASAYARLEEITAYLEALQPNGKPLGALDSRGRPRGAMRLYWTAYREVMAGLKQLGATPAGRAEMAGPVAALRSARAAEEAQRELQRRYGREVAG